MFKKSLVALLALAMATLSAILVYAVFWSDKDQALAEGEALLRTRSYADAVNHLELTARSLRNDPLRMDRLLRLRQQANDALGNAAYALRDVDELLGRHPDDEELQLDRIRLLALTDDGPGARSAAAAFLASHPRHSRGLELAGETCQKLYLPKLLALRTDFDRDLAPAQRGTARDDLDAYIYRPDGDPQVTAAADRLHAAYRLDAPRMAAWPQRWQALQELRTAAQEALRWFEQSLEAGGRPVAAFRAVALAFEQSQRLDDLLLECELQRRLFDHDYVFEAGATAAWTLLRRGLPAAAAATVERWLPSGAIDAKIAAGLVPPGVEDLLLARIHAAWQMMDKPLLMRSWKDASALAKAKAGGPLSLPLASAIVQHTTDYKDVKSTLRWAANAAMQAPVAPGQIDALPGLSTLRLQHAAADDVAERTEILRSWATARPDSVEPHVALASLLAAQGDANAAQLALQRAMALAPADDRWFEQTLQLARERHRGTPQDGDALLAQCVRRNKTEPEVVDPLGNLLCAEAALAQKAWPVAIGAAAAAIREFPRERLPRRLEAEALLGAGRVDLALRSVERLLQGDVDLATLRLARKVYVAAGQPLLPLLGRLLTQSPPNFELQSDVLESLRSAPPRRAAQFVPPSTNGGPVPLRALGVQYLARAGDHVAAAAMLDSALSMAESIDAQCAEDLLLAIAAVAAATANGNGADQDLAAATARRLGHLDAIPAKHGKLLLTTAQAIARTHPRTAFTLLEPGLVVAAPSERTGADWALACRLALRAGRWRQAEELGTAAIAFADGAGAAQDLARLLLAQGRTERARTVLAVVDRPHDAALVHALFGAATALPVMATAMQADAADLLAHALLALAGQPSMTDWRPASDEAARERIELLAGLGDPALAPLLLPRVRALAEQEPESRTTRLLLARALAGCGLGAEAAAVHEAMRAAGIGDPVFHREVALLADTPGYVATPELVRSILDLATTNGLAGSPVSLAFATRELDKAFRAAGKPELADSMRIARLVADPTAEPANDATLALLVGRATPGDQVHVATTAVDAGRAHDRAAWLDALHRAALARARGDASFAAAAVLRARADLGTDGARGPIVRLLLELETGRQEAATRELLMAHLRLVASGDDDGDDLTDLLDAMQALDGQAALLQRIDEALHSWPTALPLWLARAQRLADSPQGPRALADLRSVIAHAHAATSELGFLVTAAESGRLDPHDIAHLAALQPLHGTPTGAYAAALCALRIGQPDAAGLAFTLAGAQRNGMHLLARALAALQSDAPDSLDRARAHLGELQRDYARSSAARNVGTFLNQLAGR